MFTRSLTHTSIIEASRWRCSGCSVRDLHSNYGPTADTGGLMHAPRANDLRLRQHRGLCSRANGEAAQKSPLPGTGGVVTERPSDSHRPV
jgi:hypothetical protein